MFRPSFDGDDSDDRLAEKISANVEAMADRAVLLRYAMLLGAVNLLIWLCVLIVPASVREAFDLVRGTSGKIPLVVLAVIFGIGMWLTYALFRLKFPDIEDQNLDSNVMGTYAYQGHSAKRWWIWTLSAIGGVVNVLLLIFVTLWLTR